MYDFSFLTEQQCKDIFKNNEEAMAAITDFSILLGGYVSDFFYADNDNTLANRTGYYWTKTPYNGDVLSVNDDGSIY